MVMAPPHLAQWISPVSMVGPPMTRAGIIFGLRALSSFCTAPKVWMRSGRHHDVKRVAPRRLCLYALRGAAVARLKAAGLAPRAIAALLGHRSSNTAFRHYPHARHSKGWRVYIAIIPHPHSMARVRDSYQPFEAKLLQRSGSLRVRLNAEHCAAEHRIMGNASNGNDYPLADTNDPEGMQGEASPEAPECGEGMLDGNRNSCLGC
jgi:hypothetical protein